MLKIKSLLASMGRFTGGVGVGEPAAPPESPHAALLLGKSRIVETTLNSPIEEREIIIRIYNRAFQEPGEDHEFLLDALIHEVAEKIGTNYQLGDDGTNIRSIDPTKTNNLPAWQEIGRASGGQGIVYRIADVTVTLIVQDSYTFAAST